MIDKKKIFAKAKDLGFCRKGNFLIGCVNEDLISGLAVDAAPSETYLWTFIVPRFDDLHFLHMSLGARMRISDWVTTDAGEVAADAWAKISFIKTSGQLIEYLEEQALRGEYADWARLLCSIRSGAFDDANKLMEKSSSFQSAEIPRKLKQIQDAKLYGGWVAVQELLVEWAEHSNSLIEGCDRVRDT